MVRFRKELTPLKAACSTCNLRRLCLPSGLTEPDIDKLDAIVNRQRVKSGQHLYHAGDRFQSLYAIRLGFFKTYESNKSGREHVTGFHLTGELIGLDAISTEVHSCSAVALEGSEICKIPFLKLEDLTREIPGLQRQFNRLMSREINADQRFMMVLGTLNAQERMAAFLLNLSERLEARGLSPYAINMTMNREDIGNYLGLTIETVSRVFSRLQKDGLMGVGRRQLTIKDAAGLRRIAGYDVDRTEDA